MASETEIIKQPRRQACVNSHRLSKATFLAMIGEGSAAFYDGLDNDDWSIRSFNPTTREVCITLHTSPGDRVLSYVLPTITWSG